MTSITVRDVPDHVRERIFMRPAVSSGRLPADTAGMAHADLARLSVSLFPYEPYAPRVWELRDNVTSYDAWYVGMAESLAAPLATLDGRLTRAAGPQCEFVQPTRLMN